MISCQWQPWRCVWDVFGDFGRRDSMIKFQVRRLSGLYYRLSCLSCNHHWSDLTYRTSFSILDDLLIALPLMRVDINTNSLQINIYANSRCWSELSWLQPNSRVGVSAGQKCCSAPLRPFLGWMLMDAIIFRQHWRHFFRRFALSEFQQVSEIVSIPSASAPNFFGNIFERPVGICTIMDGG